MWTIRDPNIAYAARCYGCSPAGLPEATPAQRVPKITPHSRLAQAAEKFPGQDGGVRSD